MLPSASTGDGEAFPAIDLKLDRRTDSWNVNRNAKLGVAFGGRLCERLPLF
jgi:hypothetical protein